MIIYADVLIILNFAIDYFLLLLSARFSGASPPLWRLLLGSAAGGASSLYIFLPPSPAVLELIMRCLICAAITLIAFGFKGIKRFLRNCAIFFAVSVGYAGAMLALWYILRPAGMAINNSVVYFDISPVFLIVFSVAGYILAALIRRLLQKNGQTAEGCSVTLKLGSNSVVVTAIADTGNSLCDPFGCSEIIIAESKYADSLLKNTDEAERMRRFRAIPCKTVSGESLLDGFRCDAAVISHSSGSIRLRSPILAVSKQPLGGDYGAIINPKVLL